MGIVSEESKRIRAGFVKYDVPDTPIEVQRREWEETAL